MGPKGGDGNSAVVFPETPNFELQLSFFKFTAKMAVPHKVATRLFRDRNLGALRVKQVFYHCTPQSDVAQACDLGPNLGLLVHWMFLKEFAGSKSAESKIAVK